MFLFISCENRHATTTSEAICFTFDDAEVDDWFHFREVFQKYNIKSTFFICRPHLLDSAQIKKLKTLQNDGHEIAVHGMNHISASPYIGDSAQIYVENEIEPAIRLLRDNDFKITTFAYPFGVSNEKVDSLLLLQFQSVRKATYNIKDTFISIYDEIFASKENYKNVNAMGIDCNYHISLQNIETGIIRAKQNGEVLILYSHGINNSNIEYTTNPQYLEEVFRLCQKHKIKSIRFTDIEHRYK